MRHKHIFPLIALALGVLGSPTYAQEPLSKHKSECLAKLNDRTAALVTQDWIELERMAEQYSRICKGAFSANDDSSAFENIALANFKKGNAKKALSATEFCIKLYFSNSGCHVWRLEAQVALGRIDEARTSYERVERLLTHLIETNDKNLAEATAPQQKELYEAVRANLLAQFNQAISLRNNKFRSLP